MLRTVHHTDMNEKKINPIRLILGVFSRIRTAIAPKQQIITTDDHLENLSTVHNIVITNCSNVHIGDSVRAYGCRKTSKRKISRRNRSLMSKTVKGISAIFR